MAELVMIETRDEVGLIFVIIFTTIKYIVFDDRIMTSSDIVTSQSKGLL